MAQVRSSEGERGTDTTVVEVSTVILAISFLFHLWRYTDKTDMGCKRKSRPKAAPTRRKHQN
jgi:hypothetical protein